MDPPFEVVDKCEQVTRLYNRLYHQRAELYKSLWKPRFLRFFSHGHEYIVRRLRVINAHERHIMDILSRNQDRMLEKIVFARGIPELRDNLSMMAYYFEGVMRAQREFLDVELSFLDGRLSAHEARKRMESYFGLLAHFELSARECNRHLFSPAEFSDILRRNQRFIPKEVRYLVNHRGIFVVMFTGSNVMVESAKVGQFFDISKMPGPDALVQWIIIACIIAWLNLPARLLDAVRGAASSMLDAFAHSASLHSE